MKKSIPQAESILILEGDNSIAERFNSECGTADDREKIYVGRRNRVSEIIDTVEHEDSKKGEFFNRFGRLTLNPLTSLPILAVMLVLVYLFIGVFISQNVVDFTENKLGRDLFEYNVKGFVGNNTPVNIEVSTTDANGNPVIQRTFNFPGGISSDPGLKNEFRKLSKQKGMESDFQYSNPIVKIFFGEFGIITMTISYLLFLLLPLVIGFYSVMAMLEDSGYLPDLRQCLTVLLTE